MKHSNPVALLVKDGSPVRVVCIPRRTPPG